MSEPLDPRTQARVQATALEYRASFVPKLKSTPAPKIAAPVAKPIPLAPRVQTSPQAILAAVCEAWDISPGDLMSRWRPRRLSNPRFACIRLMRRMTDLSYPQIAKVLGMTDHTSAIHGMRRSNDLMHKDSAWRACYGRAFAALQTQAMGCPVGGDAGTASGQRQGQVPAKPISAGLLLPVASPADAPGLAPK